MKKYLLTLLLIIFIVPSVAFASWWNPFSWFNGWNFNKAELAQPAQTEKQKSSEEKVAELQKQLDDLKNQKSNSDTPITTTSKVINTQKKSETKEVIPVAPTTAIVPEVVTPTPLVWDSCKNIDGIQATVPLGMSPDGNGNCLPIVVKTDQQKCEDSFGFNSLYNGQKNTDGGLICGCKNGYDWNSNQTSCVAVQVKTGYQVCSEQFPNETWDGTMANGKYNCVCQNGYVLNDARTACQIPSKPDNQQQIFQLQLQYNQLQSQNSILNIQGLGYASYQSVKNMTPEQLEGWLSTSGNMTVYNANQRLVTIILQIQANIEQMDLIQAQITALQN